MDYSGLSLLFLAVAAIGGVALAQLSGESRPAVPAMGCAAAVLLLLTVVFDNLMIAAGLFHYAPSQLLGVRLGLVPIEDLAYPLAGVLLLPSLWTVLVARRARREVQEEHS